MIVVDTNTIAYFYLPTEYSSDIEALLSADSQWVAPALWRSEFRSILTLYLKKGLMDFETACGIQAQAEMLMADNEFDVDSVSVLRLSSQSGCSAYDCEFISLAKALDVRLVTSDKKLIKSFPEIAVTAGEYLDLIGSAN